MKRIVIAGGNGFIGEYLHNYFTAKGDEVSIISRRKVSFTKNVFIWDGETSGAWEVCLEGADILINLAGKSVNCRYHEANKKALVHSRVHTTELLGRALQRCKRPPALWLNASSATVYRHAEDRPMDEETGELGNDFSPGIVKAWEKTFFAFQIEGVRQVALRAAITLGKDGGVMPYYVSLVRVMAGGTQGKGTQRYSWIHAEDVARIIEWIYEHKEFNGVVNLSSPNPTTNAEFMRAVRKAWGMPFGIPMPEWMLRIGMAIMGSEPELVLKSRWVIPTRLLKAGFKFKYEKLEEAILISV